MSFGRTLYNLRTARGLTQKELSDALGGAIAQSTLGLYEVDKRVPVRRNVEMLAKFFGVPVSTFYMDGTLSDEELTMYVVDRMHSDPEFRTLFEITRKVRSADLAPVNAILKTIAKGRDADG